MFHMRAISTLSLLFCIQTAQATGLAELYSEAIESDPRLLSGKAEVGIGEAQKRQSMASLLPQASLRSSISRNYYKRKPAASERYTGKRQVLSLTQQLYNRELWLDHKVYSERVEQRRAQLDDITSTVALDVTQRYVDVLSAENELTLIQAEIESTKIQLGLLESRLKRQLAVKTDVLDVQVRLQTLKIDEIDAKNAVSIAREALTELVNREVAEPLNDFADDIPYVSKKTLEDWVAGSLKKNAYLRAYESEVAAAKNSLKKQEAAHLPSVNLQLSAQRSNIGYESAPSTDTDSVSATINLNVPIYSGGAIRAGEFEQRERIVIAEQRLEQFKRQLVKSVREAYLNTQASWDRIEASRKAINAAIKSHQAMEKGFNFGTVTVVDVLDALNKKLESLLRFKRAQYDFVMNYIQLQQFAGTLNVDKMRETSSWQVVE